MSVHYLNPEDEPRECPECGCFCVACRVIRAKGILDNCEGCNGIGQLGNPDGPRVEIDGHPDRGFSFSAKSTRFHNVGLYPTESAALEAAREAWAESMGRSEWRDVEERGIGRTWSMPQMNEAYDRGVEAARQAWREAK